MTNNHRHVATLNVLCSEQPNGKGGRLIEIRRWETPGGEHSDLVLERGCVADYDMETQRFFVPFHFGRAEASQQLDVESPKSATETVTKDSIGQ